MRTPAAILIAGALALAACGSDDSSADSMSDEEMAAASGDVTVVASERDDLTTLVAAVQAAGTIGGATIVEADIFATNGVIHVIDTVLVPS